ncbi:hypothetical protein CQJ30_13145 [Caldibacillus thermoamylovorans]|nr:hypothetical protein CQJ30_13145 [Caldibacillus thermoamylovorans]
MKLLEGRPGAAFVNPKSSKSREIRYMVECQMHASYAFVNKGGTANQLHSSFNEWGFLIVRICKKITLKWRHLNE